MMSKDQERNYFNFDANVRLHIIEQEGVTNSLSSIVNKHAAAQTTVVEAFKGLLKGDLRRKVTSGDESLRDGGAFEEFREKMELSVERCEANRRRGTEVRGLAGGEKNLETIKNTVPLAYFQENYVLEEGFLSTDSDAADLAEGLELVELQLFKRVSRAKDQLFRSFLAMGTLKAGFKKAESTMTSLRGSLQKSKSALAGQLMRAQSALQRRQSLCQLQVQLQILKALRVTLPTIQENIATESYGIALDVIEQAGELAEQKLASVKGAKLFQLQVKEVREKLRNKLETELFQVIEDYFRARVCSGEPSPHMKTQRNLEGMVEKYFRDVKNELEIGLLAQYWCFGKEEPYDTVLKRWEELVGVLIRCGECGGTLVRMRELLGRLFRKYHSELKQILYEDMLRHYPDFEGTKSEVFSHLDFWSHLQALVGVFFIFGTLLKAFRTLRGLFAKAVQRQRGGGLKAYYLQDLEVQLGEAADQCEKLFSSKLGKLVESRQEEKLSALSVPDFSLYFAVLSSIVKYLPKRMAPVNFESVRVQLLGLKSTFAAAIMRAKEQEITQSLDNQVWDECPAAAQFHAMLKFVENPALKTLSSIEQFEPPEDGLLRSGGRAFHVTPSALVMLKILYECLRLMRIVETLGDELGNKLLLLLKRYNSRLTQLVLGAGAVQMGACKNITTKHLCLSAEALALFLAQIPSILAQLKISLPSGKLQTMLVAEYEQLRSDLNNHLGELYNKLSGILAQRVQANLQDGALNIDWNKPVKNLETQDYMSRLMKELKRMHKILGGLLPPDATVHVFHQGLAEAVPSMQSLYGEIKVKNKFAAARLHVDIESFIQLLGELHFSESLRSPIESKLRQVFHNQAGAYRDEIEALS